MFFEANLVVFRDQNILEIGNRSPKSVCVGIFNSLPHSQLKICTQGR